LLIIVFISGLNLPAQNPYIQHYTTSEGLPSNTVYHIYQDSRKFIWFATDAGVVRYDGTTFTIYRKNDGLNSNELIRIKEDSFGRIWFFNLNGKLDYFFRNKIFNETDLPVLKSFTNKTFFVDFFQDRDSVIYFYNWTSEIYAFYPGNKVNKVELTSRNIRNGTINGNGELGLRYIEKNREDQFIVWTFRGIFRTNDIFKGADKIFDSVRICNVYPGHDGTHYVFAYQDGVILFNDKFHTEGIPIPFDMPVGYRGIKSILEDADGFLWIVTFDHGVYCLRNNNVVRHFDINQGQAIIQDNENNIWISTVNDGIYKINPYINLHRHYENVLFQDKGIIAMDATGGPGLWLTNGKTIYLLKNKDFFSLDFTPENTTFNVLFQFKNNRLIAGESGLKFFILDQLTPDPSSKKIHFKISSDNLPTLHNLPSGITFKKISGNKAGNEVCSYRSGSLFRLNTNDRITDAREITIGEQVFNTFYNIHDDVVINANKNYILKDNRVTPCTELSVFNNKIIMDHLILNSATELYNVDGDSIYLYDQHKFFNLTSAFGLPLDLPIRKVVYREPTLYLATYRNVYRCEYPLNILDHKPVQLQLVNINFRNIQDILVKNDSLCIASDDGLTIIPEVMIRKMKTITPIPYFQSILVNEKQMDPVGLELHLAGNSNITFNFSSINYSSTPVIYAYRMKGLDTVWTYGSVRNVAYQNLRQGKYVFSLRVRKPSAAWSEPIEYRIVVKAVFWQQPLFLLSIFIILAGLTVFILLRRKNNQIIRREIDHQLITLEQKALQSMMNPHFIFNSLGSIQNYLLQKKSGEAALYLSQFARLIRQNLNAINDSSINLEEEIDRLRNYLDLERLRTENKFDYSIEVDEQVASDEMMIPSMMLQPFLENAIWHGIAALEGKGLIVINFSMKDERSLNIQITDNGIGMRKAASYSIKDGKHLNLGMEMTRRRLSLLGKKFKIETLIDLDELSPGAPNPGTRVVLVVPVSFSKTAF
jgi:hypothetical protein